MKQAFLPAFMDGIPVRLDPTTRRPIASRAGSVRRDLISRLEAGGEQDEPAMAPAILVALKRGSK